MSLTDRLLPSAELDALKKYTYSESASIARPGKRRRLNSTCSSSSVTSTAGDSGYNSADDASSKASSLASQANTLVKSKARDTAGSPETSPEAPERRAPGFSVGQKRRRINSEPILSSQIQSDLVEKYMSRMHPSDRSRHAAFRAQGACTPAIARTASQIRDPDLEIVSAQHQIALARQRLHSYSGPIHATKLDRADLGWTAGPKAACSSDIFTRVFDGCRIMGDERSLLKSLIGLSGEAPRIKPQSQVELTAEEKKEVEAEVQYAGLAMPVDFDDEDMEYEPGAYHIESKTGSGFEDFFKLDEASSPNDHQTTP